MTTPRELRASPPVYTRPQIPEMDTRQTRNHPPLHLHAHAHARPPPHTHTRTPTQTKTGCALNLRGVLQSSVGPHTAEKWGWCANVTNHRVTFGNSLRKVSSNTCSCRPPHEPQKARHACLSCGVTCNYAPDWQIDVDKYVQKLNMTAR